MALSKYQTLVVLIVATFLIFSAQANSYDPNNTFPFPGLVNHHHHNTQQKLSSEAAEYLAAHNQVRQMKGMPPLQWDEKLAKYAQAWAEQRIDDCDHKHHSGGPYGENTYWEEYDESTPAEVTRVWTDEERNYDQSRLECKCKPETSQCMCGHYTQVVWGETERVGCGNTTCNDEQGLLVVCSYDPPGNYENENPFGKPYKPVLLRPPRASVAGHKKRLHRQRHIGRHGRGV